MSRQSDERCPARFVISQNGWFARLHGKSVSQHAAGCQLIDNGSGGIFFSLAASAGQNHQICLLHGQRHPLLQYGSIIFHHLISQNIEAIFLCQTKESISIHITNLPRLGCFRRVDNFITSRKNHNLPRLIYQRRGLANGCQNAQICGTDLPSAAQSHLTAGNIISCHDHIVSFCRTFIDSHLLRSEGFTVFYHHHGIGSRRNHAAGRNIDTFPRSHRQAGSITAHFHFSNHLQEGRQRLGSTACVTGTDCIAIYRRPVESRYRFQAHHILCQYTAQKTENRNFFCFQRKSGPTAALQIQAYSPCGAANQFLHGFFHCINL